MNALPDALVNNRLPEQDAPPAVEKSKDAKPAEEKKEKSDPTPLFWRMFGASCMSIVCALGIVLYIQIMTAINSLRADVTQLREGYVQLVPKSEFSKGYSQVTTEIQTMQAKNVTALEIWTSRVSEQERKIERMRSEHKEQVDAMLREIQLLRERLAVIESRPASVRGK